MEKNNTNFMANKSGSVETKFNDVIIYHEKNGNWFVPKNTIYAWLYKDPKAAQKLESGEYEYILFPPTPPIGAGFQKGFVPPLLRIWTKKYSNTHKGVDDLIGIVQAYYDENEEKLYVDMMTTRKEMRRKGVNSYIIKGLREEFGLEREQVEFVSPTKEGKSFQMSSKYEDGGIPENEFDYESFLKHVYSDTRKLMVSHGLVINKDYEVSDGGTNYYVGHLMFEGENGVTSKFAITYFSAREELIGSISYDLEKQIITIDFPDWNVDDSAHYEYESYAEGGEINWGEDLGGGFHVGTDVYITDSKSLFKGSTGFVSGLAGKDFLVTISINGNDRYIVVSKKGVEKLDAPEYAEGGTTPSKIYEKVKITIKDIDMGGDVVYKDEHWFRKDQLQSKTNQELGDYIVKKYGIDYGNTFKYVIVRTGETKERMAEGGAVDIKQSVNDFVETLNSKYSDSYLFTNTFASKYAKISHQPVVKKQVVTGKATWGFIVLENDAAKGYFVGDLLKAAGANSPAKGARGNILNGTAQYDKYSPQYGKGWRSEGGTFEEGVKAIEKKLVGTKVKPKYQKEYGKTYDKAEAHEAASKIKGSMRAMELAKKYSKKK